MERGQSAIVELGIGGGGYCKELLAKGNPVWAYDTFDGFPVHTASDGENLVVLEQIGSPCNSKVKVELEALGVTCVQGEFPATFRVASPETVIFVHVDMDTYLTTEAALRLFHERMVEGGEFMVHDYDNAGLPGVRRATDEFINGPSGVWYDCDYHAGHYRLRKRISPKTLLSNTT